MSIWGSFDPEEIQNNIRHSTDEDTLARIAAFCHYPYLRVDAVMKIKDPEKIRYAVVNAAREGYRDTALFMADFLRDDNLLREIIMDIHAMNGESEDGLLCDKLFEQIRDESVLAAFVLDCNEFSEKALERIRTREVIADIGRKLPDNKTFLLVECAERTDDVSIMAKAAFHCRLDPDTWQSRFGYLAAYKEYEEETRSYYNQLVQRQEKLWHKFKRDSSWEVRRKLSQDPVSVLSAAKGSECERELWEMWFSDHVQDMLCGLTRQLRDLDWAMFYPENMVMRMVESAPSESEDAESLADSLQYVLGTLYEKREDLHGDIQSLNGLVLYGGSENQSSLSLNVGRDGTIAVKEGPSCSDAEVLAANYIGRVRPGKPDDIDCDPPVPGEKTLTERILQKWETNPYDIMVSCRNTEHEEEMWRTWLRESLARNKNRVIHHLAHDLNGFEWPVYFEKGMALRMLESADLSMYRSEAKQLLNDLRFVYGKLFWYRRDLWEEIPEIDGMPLVFGKNGYQILRIQIIEGKIEISYEMTVDPGNMHEPDGKQEISVYTVTRDVSLFDFAEKHHLLDLLVNDRCLMYNNRLIVLENDSLSFTVINNALSIVNKPDHIYLTPALADYLHDRLKIEIGSPKQGKSQYEDDTPSQFENLSLIDLEQITADAEEMFSGFQRAMKYLMKKKKITEQELSERTGISVDTIKRMRTQPSYNPSLRFVVAVCVAMHCETAEALRLVQLAGFSLRIDTAHRRPEDNALIFCALNCLNENVANCNRLLISLGIPPLTSLEPHDHYLSHKEIRQEEEMIAAKKKR